MGWGHTIQSNRFCLADLPLSPNTIYKFNMIPSPEQSKMKKLRSARIEVRASQLAAAATCEEADLSICITQDVMDLGSSLNCG